MTSGCEEAGVASGRIRRGPALPWRPARSWAPSGTRWRPRTRKRCPADPRRTGRTVDGGDGGEAADGDVDEDADAGHARAGW